MITNATNYCSSDIILHTHSTQDLGFSVLWNSRIPWIVTSSQHCQKNLRDHGVSAKPWNFSYRTVQLAIWQFCSQNNCSNKKFSKQCRRKCKIKRKRHNRRYDARSAVIRRSPYNSNPTNQTHDITTQKVFPQLYHIITYHYVVLCVMFIMLRVPFIIK